MANHSLLDKPFSRILRKIVSLALLFCTITLCAEDSIYVEIESLGYWLYQTSHTARLVSVENVVWSGYKEVPASVTHNKVAYTVTIIGKFAFYNNNELTGVSIPNCVKRIDSLSFAQCTALHDFYVHWSASELATVAYPKVDTMSIFQGVTCGNVTLHVPQGTKAAYQAKKPWSRFIITEPTPTAITNTDTNANAIKVLRDGQIFIVRGNKEFTIQGQEVRKN